MRFRQTLQLSRGPWDMVPMATVVLLLLCFFLLCSTLILQPGVRVKINLPSSGVKSLAPQSRLIITAALGDPARPDGQIFFNDERIENVSELHQALKKVAMNEPGQTVVLKADKRLSQGRILEIMNASLSAGLPVVIATEPFSNEKSQ